MKLGTKHRLIGAVTSVATVLVCSTACGNTDAERGLTEFYGQRIEWGSCAGFAGGDALGTEIECARVLVPIDYDKPEGNTAQIAVSRLRARGERIGSVVLNPGGPGGSGLGMVSMGKTGLSDRFDVVGFDPRGLGASTPRVECLTESETATIRPDDFQTDWTPAGIETAEQKNRDYVAKCVQRSGNELLAHVGTREVAKDLDVIRAALGEEKLTYLGYSYGTRIGTTYAEAFPRNVRAMVLDSGIPLDSPVNDMVAYYASLQQGFDAYVRDCAAQKDCPLGTDPEQASNVLQDLLSPLITQPITVGAGELTYSDVLLAVVVELYDPAGWSTITTGLQQLRSGHGEILRHAADGANGIVDTALQNAVLCLDGPRYTDRATVSALQQRMFAAAPFLDPGRFAGQAPLDKCAFWPAPPSSAPHTFEAPGVPIIVVAATGDPATAYEGNRKLARQLGIPLVTFQGKLHGVFLNAGSPCIDTPVLSFLTDLALPPAGLDCR